MNKKVLIIIIAAVVVIGAAAFVFFSGMLTGGAQEPVDKPIELTYYIPGEEGFVTNVVDSRMLLKTALSLGFDKTSIDATFLDENLSKLSDIINRELRMLTEEDISDPEILDILKDQLIAAISDGMEIDNLHDVRFTAFVAQ